MIIRPICIALLSFTLLATSLVQASTEACNALVADVNAASSRHDIAGLERSYSRMVEENCKSAMSAVERLLANHLWANAEHALGQGASLSDVRPLLEDAIRYAGLYPPLVNLGDLHAARNEHETAVDYYQRAMDAIADETLTPIPPPEDEIQRIINDAKTQRQLAKRYVRTSRSSEPGGLARSSLRGYQIREVPVPVTFVFGTATFTPKGDEAVADMLWYLNRQGPEAITLIGHTDEVGSWEYNKTLSEQRAQAVADYLARNGFTGRIRVIGRSFDEPYEVDNPDRYTEAQRHQLDRRVVLVRD